MNRFEQNDWLVPRSAPAGRPIPPADLAAHPRGRGASGSEIRRWLWPLTVPVVGALLTAGLLSLTCMTIPTSGLGYGAEDGWCSVLSYAHQHGLQFGRDIVHPYGPLGFLISPRFAPSAATARMFVDVALSLTVVAGVCLVAWRLEVRWRFLVLGVFALVASNIEYASQDLLINLGLLSWALLCVLESRRHLHACVLMLVLLAVFSGLAKISCLVVSGLTIATVTLDLWIRKERWLSLWTMTSFLLGMFVVWMIAGQALSNIAAFLARGLTLSAGYEQTMALKPPIAVLVGGLLVAGLSAALVLTRCLGGIDREDKPSLWRSPLQLTWLLSILFLTWKHGFLRADPHHNAFFLGFAAVSVLVIKVLPCTRPRPQACSVGLAWTACILSLLTLQTTLYPQYLHLDAPVRRAVFNARALLNPPSYFKRMEQAMSQEKRVIDLPSVRQIVGAASVDVFGNYQSYAVLNELNYRPRPVFQSYTAFTAPLMALNEKYHLSMQAPDYVLFRVGPIDERFPSLEDSFLFRDLLMSSELTGEEGWFLLLKVTTPQPARLTLLKEGTVRPGERIDFSAFGDTNVWLQIDVNQTLLGNLRRVVYQPAGLRLHLRAEEFGSREKEFRAPSPMLAAGFIASPLLTDNQQVLNLYRGQQVPRPTSYSVEFEPALVPLWKPEMHFRAYQIENPLGFRASSANRGAQGSGS